jgi:hypothetical protein
MDSDSQPETDYSEDGVDLTLIRWMLSSDACGTVAGVA